MAQRILGEHFSDVQDLFDEQFATALPAVVAGDLQRRIGCANAAAWGLVGEQWMLEHMNAPGQPQPTLEQVFDSFLEFAVAGMTHDGARPPDPA